MNTSNTLKGNDRNLQWRSPETPSFLEEKLEKSKLQGKSKLWVSAEWTGKHRRPVEVAKAKSILCHRTRRGHKELIDWMWFWLRCKQAG